MANSTEISQESFQKFRKLLNFRSANYQPKILEIPGAKLNGKKTPGKIFQKILGIPRDVVLLLEILEKVLLFTIGSCRKIQTETLGQMESVYYAYSPLPCFPAIFGQIFFCYCRGAWNRLLY